MTDDANPHEKSTRVSLQDLALRPQTVVFQGRWLSTLAQEGSCRMPDIALNIQLTDDSLDLKLGVDKPPPLPEADVDREPSSRVRSGKKPKRKCRFDHVENTTTGQNVPVISTLGGLMKQTGSSALEGLSSNDDSVEPEDSRTRKCSGLRRPPPSDGIESSHSSANDVSYSTLASDVLPPMSASKNGVIDRWLEHRTIGDRPTEAERRARDIDARLQTDIAAKEALEREKKALMKRWLAADDVRFSNRPRRSARAAGSDEGVEGHFFRVRPRRRCQPEVDYASGGCFKWLCNFLG